jgi:hypothetical protein
MRLSDEQKYLKLCLFILIRRIFNVENQKHYHNWNEFLILRASLFDFTFLLIYSLNYAKYPYEVGQVSEHVELINQQGCSMIFWAQLEL